MLQNLQEDSLVREFQEVPVARVVLVCQAILGNLVVPLQKQTNKQKTTTASIESFFLRHRYY